MSPRAVRFFAVLALAASRCFSGSLEAGATAGYFRAGIALRVITPDPLLPVSGGVGPSHPVTRKAGELTVRALVLEENRTRVAICSVDALGFPAMLANRVRAAVKEIPAENILIGATHTHSAPDCYGFPDGKGAAASDPKYLQAVCDQLAKAIHEAVTNLQPVHMKAATGEAKGKIAYNYYAPQLYDPRCHVLQFFTDRPQAGTLSSHPVATLVNYAIHPEVLGSDAGICSPDLVGPLCDRIGAVGGGTAIFINSAQGGMVTADNRRAEGGEARTWEECQRIGNLLAEEAARIVQDAPVQASPKLACFSRTVTFPVETPLMKGLVKQISPGSDGEHVTTRLNLLNVGNAQILTIPGEALPNIGYYLKRKMKGGHNLLFGLTNDAFGYILTKEDYNSFKRYEYISRTSLGEHTGEILVNEAIAFIDGSPAPAHLNNN